MQFLVIDGNNLAYKIYASFSSTGGGLTTSGGIPTTVLFGFLNSLQTFASRYRVDKAVVAWDVGGGSAYRRGLYPLYKGNRDYKDMGDFFAELDLCREFLEKIGLEQMPVKGIEADDVIGWVVKMCKAKGDVIIYSDDKDYYQLLDDKVSIYRPCKDTLYTLKHFHEEFGEDVEPRHLVLVDALCGQEKDFIPGACDVDKKKVKMIKYGFGPAKAFKLLRTADWSLKEAKKLLKAGGLFQGKFGQQLLKNWKSVLLSRKLSKIRTANKSYSEEELEKLKSAFEKTQEKRVIKVSSVIRFAKMLEISSINIPKVLRSVGVKLKGKEEMKTVKVKM